MGQFWDGPGNVGWQSLAAKLEEQTRAFWAIDSISSAINSAMTTEEMLRSSIERVAQVTGSTSGCIYVPQGDGSWLLGVGYNVDSAIEAGHIAQGPESVMLKLTLEANGPLTHSERLNELPHFISAEGKAEETQSWAAVPIVTLGRVWGVMALSSRKYDGFSAVQLELLRIAGQLLGISLSNTVMHEQALREAGSQYRRQLIEMEAVLGSMSDGLIICDGEGGIVRANRAAGHMLGRSQSALTGSSVLTDEWKREADEQEDAADKPDCTLHNVIHEGKECRNYIVLWQGRGQQRTLSLNASPIRRPGGQQEGTVILLRDVTDESRINSVKEEFLSLLSHELRGPLTVISGYAQMLMRRLKKLDLHEELNYAALIKENAVRMSGMLGDMVDSGRLESGMQAITKERNDLANLALNVAARIGTEQSHARNFHSIEVIAEPNLPQIELDPRRIDQVLTNLITNAIKYSPDGGPIEVRVETAPPDKHYVSAIHDTTTREFAPPSLMVSVTDRGAGVPPEERRLIFDRAYRGERGKTINAQGLGLGLYISRLAVEAHGGHIGVEDGPGGVGSTFWFTIPLE